MAEQNNCADKLQHDQRTEECQSEPENTIEVGLEKLKNTLNSLEGGEDKQASVKAMSLQQQENLKTLKGKAKKNRELGDLEDNLILASRLRSDSGNVYSSSVTIDANKNIPSVSVLDPVGEENEINPDPQGSATTTEMRSICSDGECCRNTAKIVTMIQKLQKSVDAIRTASDSQLSVNATIGEDMREIQNEVAENSKEIQELEKELTDYKFQMKLIANVVVRQDQQIATLTRKINEAQQREMYPNLVISGVPEHPKENTLAAYNRFVAKELEIPELIPAHRAYRIGSGTTRPMIVELRDPITSKPKICSHVSKLKGKSNPDGGRFFVADHLPEEFNENRR